MIAEIVSTGTEILLGKTLNTSAYYLTEQLSGLGIEVDYHTTVGDDRERIKQVLTEAFRRSDLVIVTGGLGPTADDLTKEVVSEVLDLKMDFDDKSMETINHYYKEKQSLPPGSEKQAFFPHGAAIVPNIVGTAPGAIIKQRNKYFIILPGPPSELKPMFEKYVLPQIEKLSKDNWGKLHVRILKVFGLGESELELYLTDLMKKTNPFLTLLDKHTYMELRISVRSHDEQKAHEMLSETEKQIRNQLGNRIFAVDQETHAGEVGKLLRKHGLTLATAESCTGGLLAGSITSESGSSDYYLGGVVSYANTVKEGLLGVKKESLINDGAVSEIVAREMADDARKKVSSDIAISTTGIAGPAGGTDEKPVGLVYIGLAHKDGVQVQKCQFVGDRQSIRNMTVETALNMVRTYLIGLAQ